MEDTISILGLDKALELLAETTEIQENGGKTMSDGRYVLTSFIFFHYNNQVLANFNGKFVGMILPCFKYISPY